MRRIFYAIDAEGSSHVIGLHHRAVRPYIVAYHAQQADTALEALTLALTERRRWVADRLPIEPVIHRGHVDIVRGRRSKDRHLHQGVCECGATSEQFTTSSLAWDWVHNHEFQYGGF